MTGESKQWRRAAPLRHLDGGLTNMLHWYAGTFELPPGAALLVSTPPHRHQAFTWGQATLAFQCHPQVRSAQLERWFIGHAAEFAAAGLSVPDLCRDDATCGFTLEAQGQRCLTDRLNGVGL